TRTFPCPLSFSANVPSPLGTALVHGELPDETTARSRVSDVAFFAFTAGAQTGEMLVMRMFRDPQGWCTTRANASWAASDVPWTVPLTLLPPPHAESKRATQSDTSLMDEPPSGAWRLRG